MEQRTKRVRRSALQRTVRRFRQVNALSPSPNMQASHTQIHGRQCPPFNVTGDARVFPMRPACIAFFSLSDGFPNETEFNNCDRRRYKGFKCRNLWENLKIGSMRLLRSARISKTMASMKHAHEFSMQHLVYHSKTLPKNSKKLHVLTRNR